MMNKIYDWLEDLFTIKATVKTTTTWRYIKDDLDEAKVFYLYHGLCEEDAYRLAREFAHLKRLAENDNAIL